MAYCPLLAQSRHPQVRCTCPLSGVKRTSRGHAPMSAFDPKRTSGLTSNFRSCRVPFLRRSVFQQAVTPSPFAQSRACLRKSRVHSVCSAAMRQVLLDRLVSYANVKDSLTYGDTNDCNKAQKEIEVLLLRQIR